MNPSLTPTPGLVGLAMKITTTGKPTQRDKAEVKLGVPGYHP